jgi:hypothetical protein
MKITLFSIFALISSCSHLPMDDVVNLISGKDERAAQAWSNLPKIIGNYLYDDNSPVFAGKKSRHEDDLNETLAIIYSEGNCYGPNGKKQSSESLCKEISDLVGKVKIVRGEIMKLHTEKAPRGYFSEDSSISDAIDICADEFSDYTHERSTGDTNEMMLGCKKVLESNDIQSLMKRSKEIRNHYRSKDLSVEQLDAFNVMRSGLNEKDVNLALSNISKNLPSLKNYQAKNAAESSLTMYCKYLEAYKYADDLISETENPYKRQKLINDKKKMPQVMDALKLEYRKNTGKNLEESSCNL